MDETLKTGWKPSRATKVMIKTPAPVQITAEQILREANERRDTGLKIPRQTIVDKEELNEYQGTKRREFESKIRANRYAMSTWCQYAAWEINQNEMNRARSIFERALEIEYTNQLIWIRYVEMEMKHRNINRARNLFDRVVTLLPRVDTFWYKYAYMEELMGNINGVRNVFERWLKWEPPEEVWMAYMKMELRYKEVALARKIMRRFVELYPDTKNWIKWAKFELSNGKPELSRAVYELCSKSQPEELLDQNYYVSFASFEVRQGELERARAIYKYAIDNLPDNKIGNLKNTYLNFKKQYDDIDSIDDAIILKRRTFYEKETVNNPKNYDNWLDYIRLEESSGNNNKIRDVYNRAISVILESDNKRTWSRYIYIWLFYAIWEEEIGEIEKARDIYKRCLSLIPHKKFTFAKVWLQYADFLIRRKELIALRRTLFTAINTCPKGKLFKGFIEIELQLKEFDRVRNIYTKYLAWNPVDSRVWIKYAELENMLGDIERCRGILNVAIDLPEMDLPEAIWKAYIDTEIEEEEWDRARNLYEKLLSRTEHVKVWISYANFENIVEYGGENCREKNVAAVRNIFERACSHFLHREGTAKREKLLILEAWKQFEKKHGDSENLKAVLAKFPSEVKRSRPIIDRSTGETIRWEEYTEYKFPEDETEASNLKLLAVAHEWKKKLLAEQKDTNKS